MAFNISHFKPSTIFPTSTTSRSTVTLRRHRPILTTCTMQPSKSQAPSIEDIERAIGIASDPANKSKVNIDTSIMDLLESTPIGKEGPAEKALRVFAEKFTDHAEEHTASVHRSVLELFVMVLPLWLLVVAVASGLIKLPFNVPYIDDLIM